jgi:hypothetical protein
MVVKQNNMDTIRFEKILPVGNFDFVLKILREKADEEIAYAHEKGEYHSGLAEVIKQVCSEFAIIDVLEEGLVKGEGWNMEEMMQCLLYAHLIIIDLNQTAHTYLNKGIDWESPMVQLQEMIDGKPEVYKGLRIE